MDVEEYQTLKRCVETAQQDLNKAEGALTQLMNQLKKEFNCSTIEQAEKKLKELEKKQKQLEIEFNKQIKQFKEKWLNNA